MHESHVADCMNPLLNHVYQLHTRFTNLKLRALFLFSILILPFRKKHVRGFTCISFPKCQNEITPISNIFWTTFLDPPRFFLTLMLNKRVDVFQGWRSWFFLLFFFFFYLLFPHQIPWFSQIHHLCRDGLRRWHLGIVTVSFFVKSERERLDRGGFSPFLTL